MKKVLALVLASLLTISLAGCNDSKTNTPADGSSGSTNETETAVSYTHLDVYKRQDRILDIRRAASLKAGGTGIRYTCRIRGREKYLWLEETRWFIEAKESD